MGFGLTVPRYHNLGALIATATRPQMIIWPLHLCLPYHYSLPRLRNVSNVSFTPAAADPAQQGPVLWQQ